MDASQQVWMSEDLLEHLLPMLDLPTMKNFASANPLALSVLSRPPMWRRILKRTYQPVYKSDDMIGDYNDWKSFRQEAPMIADLLKMLEDQQSGLYELLDYVCEAFPLPECDDGKVKLSVCGRSRTINGVSFMLMESVVSHLEFNVMEVEEFSYEDPDDMERDPPDVEWDELLDALVSHVPRQQREVNSIKIQMIGDSCDSEKFLATLGKSTSWSIDDLFIDDSFEPGHEYELWTRWAELAAKGEIKGLMVHDSEFGCPEAMRKVWLAVTEEIHSEYGVIFKSEGENGWARFLKIIEEKGRMATRKRKRDTDDE